MERIRGELKHSGFPESQKAITIVIVVRHQSSENLGFAFADS